MFKMDILSHLPTKHRPYFVAFIDSHHLTEKPVPASFWASDSQVTLIGSAEIGVDGISNITGRYF
jgi:hypothetical protein